MKTIPSNATASSPPLDPNRAAEAAPAAKLATSSTPTAPASTPGSVDEIEIFFSNLVEKKVKAGLSRSEAIRVAMRQLERDASAGKFAAADVKKWMATAASRVGNASLGVR